MGDTGLEPVTSAVNGHLRERFTFSESFLLLAPAYLSGILGERGFPPFPLFFRMGTIQKLYSKAPGQPGAFSSLVLLAVGIITSNIIINLLDISIGTVHNIMKEPMEDIEVLVEHIKKRLAAKHYLLSDHILNKITDYNILKASLQQKVLSSAILTDKARLLEGKTQRK